MRESEAEDIVIGFSEDRERIEVGETRKFVAILIIIGLEDICGYGNARFDVKKGFASALSP